MKNSFITALAGYFIEKEYFHPVIADNEALDFSKGIASLIKDFNGTTVLLEIIDADMFSSQQIASSMEQGAELINKLNGRNATAFKLFLFDGEPESDKLGIITEGQVDITSERKFLKTLSINISEGTVRKHFSVPAFDAKIVSTVKRFFSRKLDKVGTTAEDILKLLEQRNKDYEVQMKVKKPWLTYGIIIVNILVWLLIKLISFRSGIAYTNYLEPFGAKINSLIIQGQYWRFVTPMFLHADEIHLALNCYSLFIVGSQVEKIYGRFKFSLIYFVAGILGNIVSFAFSINPAVGASGAIFGLTGAMLFFAMKRPSLLKSSYGVNLITTIVINLAYGFMNSRIDNSAHMGGFVGGFLITGVVATSKEETKRDKLVRIVSLIMALMVTTAATLYGFNNQNNKVVPMLTELQTLYGKEDWAGAEEIGEDIIALNPSDKNIRIETLWDITASEFNQQKYEEAISHGNQLLKESPANGNYLLGVIYYSTAQYDSARQYLQKAKELDAPYTDNINQILSDIETKVG